MFGRIKHLELIKVAIFGALSIMFVLLLFFGLVSNKNGVVDRYNSLIAADKAGGDVETSLNELREYIYSHMNTELSGENNIYPPIQLSGTYDRLVAAEESRVKQANDNLYAEAQAYCESTSPQGFSGSNRIGCINKYIDDNGAKVQQIDDSFYKYDFVAPRWSPDLAGFSSIGLIIFGFLTVFNLFMYYRTKYIVHIGN